MRQAGRLLRAEWLLRAGRLLKAERLLKAVSLLRAERMLLLSPLECHVCSTT